MYVLFHCNFKFQFAIQFFSAHANVNIYLSVLYFPVGDDSILIWIFSDRHVQVCTYISYFPSRKNGNDRSVPPDDAPYIRFYFLPHCRFLCWCTINPNRDGINPELSGLSQFKGITRDSNNNFQSKCTLFLPRSIVIW